MHCGYWCVCGYLYVCEPHYNDHLSNHVDPVSLFVSGWSVHLISRYSLLPPHCIPDRQFLFSTSHIKNPYTKHMTTTISSFQYRDTKLHHAKLRISHSSTNVHEMALNMQTKVAQQVHPAKPRAIPPLHVATGF